MSDDMKEVKRLAHAYADAKLVRYGMNSTDPLSANPEQAFAELLAHIHFRDSAIVAAFERINEWCRYATKEGAAVQPMALQQIGQTAREVLAKLRGEVKP